MNFMVGVGLAEAGHAGAALAASDAFRMGRGVPRDFRRAAYFLGLCTALDPAPPGITALLGPSLATDLDEAERGEVDRAVAAAVAHLPRADAELDGYWCACAAKARVSS
jgi:TPR repeat protein